MPEIYSDQYKKAYVDVPSAKIPPGEQSGSVWTLVATHTFAADVASLDTLALFKLPANCRVISCVVKNPADLGGTGTIDVGYTANGVDAADPDGFVASYDGSGQAAQTTGTGAAIFKDFSVETKVQALFTGVTSGATGKSLIVVMQYVNY